MFRHTVNLPDKSAHTMAYRRAVNLLWRERESVFSLWLPRFQKSPNVIRQTVKFHEHINNNHCARTRSLHTSTPLMVAKLLSLDELFAKRSLQEHLKKMETEYSECLRVANNSVAEEQCSEDELREKRTKVSLLAPLIQSIRELDTKQKEMAETETLLKGETANTRCSLTEDKWCKISKYEATIPRARACVCVCLFFFLKDEDPALRELAELEREGCLQDIQDLRQKVKL